MDRKSAEKSENKLEEIEALARAYHTCVQKGHQEEAEKLLSRIWLETWGIKEYVFHSEQLKPYCSVKTSMYNAPYTLDGHYVYEFLETCFFETLPEALKDYKPDSDEKKTRGFLSYLIYRIRNKAIDELQKEYWRKREIEIKSSTIEIKRKIGRKWVSCSNELKTGVKYNVLGEETDSDTRWYKIEKESHGTRYLVRADDTILYENALISVDDDEEELPLVGAVGVSLADPIRIDVIIDIYVIQLLALVKQLCEGKREKTGASMTKGTWYQMLYTEKLVEKLKAVYLSSIESSKTVLYAECYHEKEVMKQAMLPLIDFILTECGCQTFIQIMRTKLKQYKDFVGLPLPKRRPEDTIKFPIEAKLYELFMKEILNIEVSGIAQTRSKCKKEFDQMLKEFEQTAKKEMRETLM